MIGTRSGQRMQAVNILGEYHGDLFGLLKLHDCMMHGVGSSCGNCSPAFQLVVPMLDPRGFRCHEILIIDRLTSPPNALRSTEIGNTTSGRDARAGKYQHPSCDFDISNQFRCRRIHCVTSKVMRFILRCGPFPLSNVSDPEGARIILASLAEHLKSAKLHAPDRALRVLLIMYVSRRRL